MTADEMQIEILMKEYATMRDEVLLHFRNAKLHLRHFQAFVGSAAAVVWYLFLFAEPTRVQGVVDAIGINKGDLILYIIFGLNIVSYYFAFDILDSYYCVFLVAARLLNIEDQINCTWGRRLMVWEMFQSKNVAIFGASRVAITIYQILLVTIVSLVIPLLCYWRLSAVSALKFPQFVWGPVIFCILAFAGFIYAFIDVFFFKRKNARRVMDQIVAGKS